jgi:hypothetical protein
MKTWKVFLMALAAVATMVLLAFTSRKEFKPKHRTTFRSMPRGCVYRTVMGEESSDSSFVYFTSENANAAIVLGLAWIIKAQNQNGGWGAGSHYSQDVIDPRAVPTDPATTAMVSMALLRSGSSLNSGAHAKQLSKALGYILKEVESAAAESLNITNETGTQIQIKLGANIDVVLASQFLSNLLDGNLEHDKVLKERVKRANNICVAKIQRADTGNGNFAGAGWAGVLQSSFATNALESAQSQGADVDDKVLRRARQYQKSNFDSKTGQVNTDMGAGVVLYSVTGSARASAKEARKVEEEVKKAIAEGRLYKNASPTTQNLEKIGFSKSEAIEYSTSYEVYNAAKTRAQEADVMSGFGNNGGEEFLSYLQTGESLIISKDDTWRKWYDSVSGRLISIQNDDGSWNGHHCITSPVFCTATCLLILSVNNDVDKLLELGREKKN